MTQVLEHSSQTPDGLRAGGKGRIAFVVSQFPETHETFILREFTALADMGLDFLIFSLKPCRDKVIQKDAYGLLDRTYYPSSGKKGAGRLIREAIASRAVLPWARSPIKCVYIAWAAVRFAELAQALGVKHIHAHWATAPTSAAALMSRLTGAPYSFTAHAWDIYAGDSCLREKAAGARFVVTCTRANVKALRRSVPGDDWDKVILNYHGIPMRDVPELGLREAEGRTLQPLRITAVGRLVETKGFSYLLEALRDAEFPYDLTIVGDGPLRAQLEKAAGKLRSRGTVKFTGVVPNERVFEILSGSDCFVMPSVVARNGDRDGIPNVMLEAMSVGLPVVASEISGIPEAVIDSETGFLVRERDPAGLLSALRRLSDDRALGGRMGECGRRLVRERFDATENARRLLEIFGKHVGAHVK